MRTATPYCRALLIAASHLYCSSAMADNLQSWADLPKVSKPTDDGFQDKLAESQRYLNFGGRSTRLPGDSLLHVPAKLAERVTERPAFPLLPWRDFLTLNPSWLRTVTVTWDQVQGKKALSPELEAALATFQVISVATFRTFPITVHKPSPDPELGGNSVSVR